MFKTLTNLIKRLKVEISNKKKLEKENEILKAKLKLLQQGTMQAFIDGNINTWTLVQVIIFDMYKNMEIVDYETLVNKIAKNLTKYDRDKTLRDEKIKQFNTAIRLKQKIINGGGDANNN